MAARVVATVPDLAADVFGLDAAGTLGVLEAEQAKERSAAAAKMAAATRWADLHRVTDGVPGAVDPVIAALLPREATIAGLQRELRLAGQGAFMVEEFAVCELATALEMSELAARAYLGQALEVRDRLPRCWAKVMTGALADWKARQIAEQTIALSDETAAYVDGQLAAFAHQLSLGRVLKCVEAAVLRFEPDLAAERAARAAEHRGVWIEDRADGLSELHAVADSTDAHGLDSTLDHAATALGRLGDPDPHQVRRAKALGVLADPQYALDLLTDPDNPRHSTSNGMDRPTVHIHLHTDTLTDTAVGGQATGATADHTADRTADDTADGPVGVARVDRVGPVAVAAVTRWLAGLAPGSTIKLTPVVDLNAHIAVDAYEIPDRLRTQIEHRDTGCVFPWCGRIGRFDLDHIEQFDFGDPDTGPDARRPPPPGQTNTANLARLCRFHHRVKTHSEWTYRRRGPTEVEWTSPHQRHYRVDHTGTLNLN